MGNSGCTRAFSKNNLHGLASRFLVPCRAMDDLIKLVKPSRVRVGFSDTALIRHFPRVAGAAIGLFGLLIIVAWQAHWRPILQMLPNSALCFIWSGSGLFLLTLSRARIALWLGGAAALFALLTLLENLMGSDFGIDTLFFNPYFEVATTYPGRMSPLAAFCFVFISAAIVLAGAKKRWTLRLTGTGVLACIAAVIAGVALFGYAFGIDAAYGWGAYSRMAVNTAGAFLLLSVGLLTWAWQTAGAENLNFLRWLPVTGSVTLMIMVAFVSAMNMADLKKATFWRKHTVEVILSAQSFEENLVDIQRGVRGYMTLGDTNALASYQASSRLESPQFHNLVSLTSDNPVQQRRLKRLAAAIDSVFSYDQSMIALCQHQGFAAALAKDTNGFGRTFFGNARDLVQAFSQEEQGLLNRATPPNRPIPTMPSACSFSAACWPRCS